MTKNKKIRFKIVLILLAILFVVGGLFGYARYQDYRKFNEATEQLNDFISYISPLGVKNLKSDLVCNRGNQKYSSGNIVCFSTKSFEISQNSEDRIIGEVKTFASYNGWKYRGENTLNSNGLSLLYKNKNMDCTKRKKKQSI